MAKKMLLRLRYGFDNLMARGLWPLVTMLSLITLLFVFIISVIALLSNAHPEGENIGWGELFWRSVLRALDGGTMAGDTGIAYRSAMLFVTLFGIILVATVTGIVSNSISESLNRLRRGRSLVLENNHTVILGWNSKAVSIINEICISNLSKAKSSIVVFCDGDKTEIEEEIKTKVHGNHGTRIVVRSGNPMSKVDLRISALHKARSIIILAPDFDTDADSFSIKTMLAIKGLDQGPSESCSIIGEIKLKANYEAAQLVGEGRVCWIMGEDLVNRLIVQSCRQGGLSGVFSDLLDFEGSEIYLLDSKELLGLEFHQANLRLAKSIAFGIINRDEVTLNPPGSRVLTSGDQLVVLAADETELSVQASPYQVDSSAISAIGHQLGELDSTLILGINPGVELLLEELDRSSNRGSKVTLIAQEAALRPSEYRNLDFNIIHQDPTVKQILIDADITKFNHIVILATRDCDTQKADARTLLCLLHVRSLTQGLDVNIVSEILDDHNRELIETDRSDDFIVSDKLVSHAISQISENSHLYPVFERIFSGIHQHIRLKPISSYISTETPVTFNEVIEAASRSGEAAIGYRSFELQSESGELHGVRLNPSRIEKFKFSPQDTVISICND